ncbi:RES family NAD+ phosphorylase [Bacillus cereus]|uniref:RES family NAD+ phosphorylase n=1 Tax=Bacillus cereus TaxID=1396 RepID=UPI003D64845C
MKWCCPKCFNDDFIKGIIIENSTVGDCCYCKRRSQSVVQVNRLKPYFERFFEIYEFEQEGVHFAYYNPGYLVFGEDFLEEIVLNDCFPLHYLLQEDWSIFSASLTENVIKELVKDILKGYKIPYLNRMFSSSIKFGRFYENEMYYEDKKDIWSRFSKEIKNVNRFFMQNSLQGEIVDLIKQKEIIIHEDMKFFRARIGYEVEDNKIFPYGKDKMGKPSAQLSSNGRANPRGISYLYSASDEDTAISEVRPWKSAIVSLIKLIPKRSLSVIDLTLTILSSPFHSNNLRMDMELIRLLESLSNEFSKPVSPFDGDIDYLPTQYIAELIKIEGFDGFKFKSSLADGDNYVFFNEEDFEFMETSAHIIENIIVKQSPLNHKNIL